jgi:hypothetical protein
MLANVLRHQPSRSQRLADTRTLTFARQKRPKLLIRLTKSASSINGIDR